MKQRSPETFSFYNKVSFSYSLKFPWLEFVDSGKENMMLIWSLRFLPWKCVWKLVLRAFFYSCVDLVCWYCLCRSTLQRTTDSKSTLKFFHLYQDTPRKAYYSHKGRTSNVAGTRDSGEKLTHWILMALTMIIVHEEMSHLSKGLWKHPSKVIQCGDFREKILSLTPFLLQCSLSIYVFALWHFISEAEIKPRFMNFSFHCKKT